MKKWCLLRIGKREAVWVLRFNGCGFSGNVTASGLYIATTYIIQKIKNEGICDVCSSVRMLRRHSENFVVDKVCMD